MQSKSMYELMVVRTGCVWRWWQVLAVCLALTLAVDAGAASLCANGRRQSPVAIRSNRVAATKAPPMRPAYRETALVLANDGHTLRVRLLGAGELELGGHHFKVQQFHFHTPGGDQIDGETFPFAAHILHRSESGQLMAIVVPFRLGASNPLLERLLSRIPASADGDHRDATVRVSAAELLPPVLDYFSYTGSLTAAPCTEGVQWLVLKHPLELSEKQLNQWQQHFADNMRGVNPLYGRAVFESRLDP